MTEPKTSTVAEAAAWYARRNIHVFPVFSIIDTPNGLSCDCPAKTNCSNPGKHPRTRHGLLDATTDADQVAKWWSMWPHANIGIACEPTGWAVIDIDINKGGDESLRDLEAQHGQL